MARESEKESSEKLQIVILTFGMTGAGFALLALILALFLNPSKAAQVDELKKEYAKLTSFLQNPEMKNLRVQAKLSEAQENKKSLREIISEAMTARQLQQGAFPMAKTTDLKAGLQKVEQTIDLKAAKMLNILQFIGHVKDAKKTIQVETVSITRDRASKDQDEDSWAASVRFVDYIQK